MPPCRRFSCSMPSKTVCRSWSSSRPDRPNRIHLPTSPWDVPSPCPSRTTWAAAGEDRSDGEYGPCLQSTTWDGGSRRRHPPCPPCRGGTVLFRGRSGWDNRHVRKSRWVPPREANRGDPSYRLGIRPQDRRRPVRRIPAVRRPGGSTRSMSGRRPPASAVGPPKLLLLWSLSSLLLVADAAADAEVSSSPDWDRQHGPRTWRPSRAGSEPPRSAERNMTTTMIMVIPPCFNYFNTVFLLFLPWVCAVFARFYSSTRRRQNRNAAIEPSSRLYR
mmetsp:Transcript_30475/g.65935  ORF Transcript_30475/g.65935 Transcript_30475/m.65935 type:complete len:274 (+) Transcript_30475:548-1369(+)